MRYFRPAILSMFIAILALPALTHAADHTGYGYTLQSKTSEFEDVRSDLEDAIINRGYVVDYVGHINKMLERTSEVAESVTAEGKKSPYKNAQYLQFCPAKITHDAISTSPQNIANCPVAIFIYELNIEPGKIFVGYRTPISGQSRKMRDVNKKLATLLADIVGEVVK